MGSLTVGWSSCDITPARPAYLCGQMYERLSTHVRDPLTATAWALESTPQDGPPSQVILISCDLVVIVEDLQERLRERVRALLPDFDARMLMVCATHTHNAPFESYGQFDRILGGAFEFRFDSPEAIPPEAYMAQLLDSLSAAAADAWKGRKAGRIGAGFDYAVVGHNRRVVYSNGVRQLQGSTHQPLFRSMEGQADHGVELLYVWDEDGKLTGIAMNVPCPAQVMEGESFITADYWSEVRRQTRELLGDDLFILPLTGACGDVSPHGDWVREGRGVEPDMFGEPGMAEIGRRLAELAVRQLDRAREGVGGHPVMSHRVEKLSLPLREVDPEEEERMLREYDALSGDPSHPERIRRQVRRRKEECERHPLFDAEIHVIRIGSIAIATNPFELFTEFGMRLKAISPARQTFVVQLACGFGAYLPTPEAARGGGYSAMALDNMVSPEGGFILVDRTNEILRDMWGKRN